MELPSMVQRSGDTLIVRSVVSGNQLYMDHSGAQKSTGGNNHNISSTSALEQQLERYRVAAQQQQHYQQQLQQHQQQQQQTSAQHLAAMELKDEGLPQCKIKRNYSCSYCTYFTQNPRYHLTHLRDVHGEKIVINKCKLCLYASRHFQKLVRHMKMVHGCTEGIPGQHGQTRKRGMNREARKRKLEQSAVEACGGAALVSTANQLVDLGSLEQQVKRELQLQNQQLRRDVLDFGKQQQDEKQRQQQQLDHSTAEAIFVAAYERQLQAQREREIEALQQQEMRNTPTLTSSNFQVPQQQQQQQQKQQQQQQISNKSLDIVSPSAPTSPPTPILTITSTSFAHDNEPTQNRLLKCSVCDFTTLYRAQLVDHEVDEHCKTKFFRCEKCSYVTHIKARFSKHVKYHSMPMIKCVTCDFRTPYKWNLDRHMKNHGGAGPFKCAACDFTADIKQSLTVHEMNHHVPPVGHAAGMSLARRRNKVGGTDLSDDFLSDSAELLEDHFNNNNLDDYEEALAEAEVYGKRGKYEEDEPTDLSHKGGSSDTSSVHNQPINSGSVTPKSKRPVPNLIPIPKIGSSVLNLSKDLAASRSSLTDIASMFFNEKQLSEMLQPLDKSDAAQLSPTTTITSTSSQHSRNPHPKKLQTGGSFFDKLKLSALTPGGPSENLICPCGHVAKYLSESIIHRKSCNFVAITTDDDIEEEEEGDDVDGRLEIDFDDDDKQSHSALNLSVTGSTRCQHCRHRCKSSADLLNHLKQCSDARRCANDSYDSLSGESSSAGRMDSFGEQQHHPMENRVFVWNKMPSGSVGTTTDGKTNDGQPESGSSSTDNGGVNANRPNEENSYYGVETAPGYGEMTPEEEAANSSLKKVYKCPHCSFWASTASRFHVHIVGHLNKKPFECSLCSYRSNWRWDITKHIRLKTIRDPSHKNARVLMNDETGRRNYTKYNKYITLMKVTEEDGDPKLMKSGEMTPNQVASLAFLNDYNKSSSNVVATLNGIKDDVTLEPISTANAATTTPPKSVSQTTGGGDAVDSSAMPEGFMRLPFIATAMMNAAALVQKQEQDENQVTLITPSVTISAVKRSPPSSSMGNKPSDDLVTDIKQEGNERKTFYKCRKCSFRHGNRDAVLAHVKIHYQDFPIVTATATSPPSKILQQKQQQDLSPLHVTVPSSVYMKKVLAAMCLSQQQQQQQQQPNPNSPSNSGNEEASPNRAQQQQQQQQQHSILSAGLLQQAIQGTSSSSSNCVISGLALALAGKSPTKGSANSAATAAVTTILEHGEQNASQNEASSSMSASSTGALQPPTISSYPPVHQASLQHLLTSPRGTHLRQSPVSGGGSGGGGGCGSSIVNNSNNNNKNNPNNLNNNNMVMGLASASSSSSSSSSAAAAAAAGATTNTNATIHSSPSSLSNISQSPNSSSTATIATATRHCRLKHAGDIRIETLDRSSTSGPERHAVPVYRPLGNGVSNDNNTTFGLTMRALQQQQSNVSNNQNSINNNNNNMLLSKAAVEQLMHSPHAANSSNSATSQDIHAAAAAAYLAAAYKAATASSVNVATTGQVAVKSTDDLLLHQQLQQNEQIEITRLPNSSSNPVQNSSATSSLAQLLEHSAAASTSQHAQQNSKCKQQKCPLCPYISESKSQMNYHISLHKPTQYECALCTFVCAKKQHLSSHMRSVHQQQINAATAANGSISNMDFSVALQLAAAAQAQQDSKSMMQSPLAIDLSALKSLTGSTFQQQKQQMQQLSNEFQLFKIVSYCDKCPACFPQKVHEGINSSEFQDHMKAHKSTLEQTLYKCDLCDFMAPHEAQLQTHRFVHSAKYHEKCSDLIRNSKEDPEHPAPKLLQITATKNTASGQPELVWIVDNELSVQFRQQQQQSTSITSSSTSLYDNTNSLLKKQLESGPAPIPMLARNTPSPSAKGGDDLSSAPSTSASVATSDLAADAGSESGSVAASPAPLEKCLHCPYETTNANAYKTHLQHHEYISQFKDSYSCEHCDYTDQDESSIAEHTRLHFNAMEKLKSVAFFTSYDQLELSTERNENEAADEEKPEEQNEIDDSSNKQQQKQQHIKQEYNNNNEEDAVNENTLQEIKDKMSLTATSASISTPSDKEEIKNNDKAVIPLPPPTDATARKSCTKIILYKNDGCLSVKKDLGMGPQIGGGTTNNSSSDRDNISDRLRRRISRSSTSHMNGSDEQQSQQSHKTILVNAKTGQVISRN